MNYDPNLNLSDRKSIQTVRLTFQHGEHRCENIVAVTGNCVGFYTIHAAVRIAFSLLFAHQKTEPAELILTRPDGDQLSIRDDAGLAAGWLMEMLVGAEIVAIEPDTQDNEFGEVPA